MGQQKMPQMIYAQIQLVTIRCQLSLDCYYSGIINQHIEYGIADREFTGKSTDALE
ncbi:hypothetical protein D3C81_2322220 [compost metagenome]